MCSPRQVHVHLEDVKTPVKFVHFVIVLDVDRMYTAGGHLLAASAGLFVQSVLGFSNLHHAAGHIHCGHVEKRLLGLPLLDSLNLPLRSNGGPVEVTGDHEWRAPVDGDQRGPCVRLNQDAKSIMADTGRTARIECSREPRIHCTRWNSNTAWSSACHKPSLWHELGAGPTASSHGYCVVWQSSIARPVVLNRRT